MQSSKIWLTLTLTMLVAIIVGCDSREVVVTLTRDEIQTRIAPSFPISKNWLVVNVILSQPEIFLPEGTNQIGINMLVEVNIPFMKPITGHLGATAVPRYDAESKSFFLDQAAVERLNMPGLIPEIQAKARTAIESIAQQELTKHPIYELKGRNLKEITAAFTLREVQVRDGKLRAIFSLPI
ncbi:MAG: DUF1439 domain-containing protein [Desulfobulbaceae bacterium]|nr:DUF1439 domain-containing protein [Desulfobulbaceae bacterium]HIJ90807.1 DUF1439 domain-containing protein [Deltaproteobacteria bacterium]